MIVGFGSNLKFTGFTCLQDFRESAFKLLLSLGVRHQIQERIARQRFLLQAKVTMVGWKIAPALIGMGNAKVLVERVNGGVNRIEHAPNQVAFQQYFLLQAPARANIPLAANRSE